ncbi:transposase [bacterium]|nr:transposase [bacterium]
MRNNGGHISEKHHRRSIRLKGYDYSSPGYYFVTICTYQRIEKFGKVKDGEMILNPCGRIIHQIWQTIPEYHHQTDLDEFIVMPNHIHGIIIIKSFVGTEQCSVPTKPEFYGLLSKIIKSFKGICTKTIRNQFHDDQFAWQRSFYDHVIRNEKALQNIGEYIINNPLKWEFDKENPIHWENKK